ncbi:DUF4351 domain-containing protein [Endothiovibrio diazotrophicus]
MTTPDDLPEVEQMLAEETDDWTLSWRRAGMEEGLAKGRAEGRVEGRSEGRREGETALLKRLLSLRFGPLPQWVDRRLDEAPLETLGRWGERILDAETLEQVFAERD